MTDWTSLPAGRPEDTAERAAREEKHQVLIELLAAYADGELPPETVSQIDAHLVGCARCRGDLAMHHAMRRRLGVEPPVAAPPELRERILARIAAESVPVVEAPAPRAPRRRWPALVVGAVVVAAAGAGLLWQLRSAAPSSTTRLEAPAATVPLLADAVADYRRVTAGDLPGRARDLDVVRAAVPFPVEPLHAPGLRLLAAWATDLSGEPAAVLAYRFEDEILLEYLVSDERFFRHPAVRRGVSGGRRLVAVDGAQGVLAWPAAGGGALLVGDLPTSRLERVLKQALVRSADGGAQ